MSAIIELGNGVYITGEPPHTLPAGHHWCSWCHGEGIEIGYDGIETCLGCFGSCIEPCADDCPPSHTKK